MAKLQELLTDHLRFCFGVSSMTGMCYVTKLGLSIFERLFWIIAIVSFGTFGLLKGLDVWDHYQTRPVIESLEMDYVNFILEYPAITICQRGFPYKDSKYNKVNFPADKVTKFNASVLSYLQDLAFNNFSSYKKAYQPYIDGEKVEYLQPEEYAMYLDLVTYILSDTPKKSKTHFPIKETLSVYPVHRIFTEVGPCSVINTCAGIYHTPRFFNNSNPYNYTPWTFNFYEVNVFTTHDISAPYSVYIHSPQEIIDIETQGLQFNDITLSEVSFTVMQTYTTHHSNDLTVSQRGCRLATENENLPHSPIYSYKLCRVECRIRLCLKFCQCTPYYYRRLKNEPICNITGMYCLSNYNTTIITLVDPKTRQSLCPNCVQMCNDQQISIYHFSNRPWLMDTMLEINLRIFPYFRYKRDLIFGEIDMLVQVGGILGLFLGSSILSFIELLYFLTLRFLWGVCGRRNIKLD